MEKEELLERYEAYGDEGVYAEARGLYERSLADGGDARALTEFGYLQECHGRRSIRAADWPRRELRRLEARLAGG